MKNHDIANTIRQLLNGTSQTSSKLKDLLEECLTDHNADLQSSNDERCNIFYPKKRPYCDTVCEESAIYENMFKYVYPILLILGIIGNGLNITVYREARLRTSAAVQLLTAKTIANIGFLLSVFPCFTKAATTSSFNTLPEFVFWTVYPTVLFLTNTFGNCATW